MCHTNPSVKMISIRVPQFMQDQIQNIVDQALELPTFDRADMFEAKEREIYDCTDRLGDLIVQRHLQAVSDSESIRQAGRKLAQAMPGRVKNQGPRYVRIQTFRGGTIISAEIASPINPAEGAIPCWCFWVFTGVDLT